MNKKHTTHDCLGRTRRAQWFPQYRREILRGIRCANTNCNRNSGYHSHAKRDRKSNVYAAASGHTATAPDAGSPPVVHLADDSMHCMSWFGFSGLLY
jgi:hypothetical protein